jgi:hypothetical protein
VNVCLYLANDTPLLIAKPFYTIKTKPMNHREAILIILQENRIPLDASEVLMQIDEKKLIDWSNAKTPKDTISSRLGDFIRNKDSRVKRIKEGKVFKYYLKKHEDEIDFSTVTITPEKNVSNDDEGKIDNTNNYLERDLHKLLSSYLRNQNIYSKTIFHEKSYNSKDSHQKWIHPDMIGIKFMNLKNNSSQALMKITNKSQTFEIISYELKREIKSDYDLKKTYFQAVSNSSWANYGYLVVFDINSNLMNEMERLNQSFGIGVIELKAKPFESEVIFPAQNTELDYKTIDKLCEINIDFEKFISHTETILSATNKYLKGTRKEFDEFCDKYFTSDSEIENYCIDKNIPFENDENGVEHSV